MFGQGSRHPFPESERSRKEKSIYRSTEEIGEELQEIAIGKNSIAGIRGFISELENRKTPRNAKEEKLYKELKTLFTKYKIRQLERDLLRIGIEARAIETE